MINKELSYPPPPPCPHSPPVLTTRAHYVNRNLSSDQLQKHLKSLFCFPSFHLTAFIIFRRTGQIFHLTDPSVLSFWFASVSGANPQLSGTHAILTQFYSLKRNDCQSKIVQVILRTNAQQLKDPKWLNFWLNRCRILLVSGSGTTSSTWNDTLTFCGQRKPSKRERQSIKCGNTSVSLCFEQKYKKLTIRALHLEYRHTP